MRASPITVLWDDCGASAVEFALVLPVLVLGLLAATDLGMAEYSRMALDHALRAGAQISMKDPGADLVLQVLQDTAARNFSSATPSGSSATVSVSRFCACPEASGIEVACSTTCNASKPTFIFYRLTGSSTYNGMVLPPIILHSAVQVQVR